MQKRLKTEYRSICLLVLDLVKFIVAYQLHYLLISQKCLSVEVSSLPVNYPVFLNLPSEITTYFVVVSFCPVNWKNGTSSSNLMMLLFRLSGWADRGARERLRVSRLFRNCRYRFLSGWRCTFFAYTYCIQYSEQFSWAGASRLWCLLYSVPVFQCKL